MYRPALTKKQLAEMETAGLTLEDFGDQTVEVWPENWPAYALFAYMRTQWRVGMAGATGLDYGPLHRKMDRMDLAPADYDDLEADIQTMEYAAISIMNDRDE